MASKTWRGLRNGEALGEQAHGDVGLPQLAPQAFHGVGDDARVAESELGEAVHRQPAASGVPGAEHGGIDDPRALLKHSPPGIEAATVAPSSSETAAS
jgi:hypothetical protein